MSFSVDSQGIVTLDGGSLYLSEPSFEKFRAIVEYLRPLIQYHSKRTKVPESWIAGIIWAETGYLGPKGGARGVSSVGATGRMQLMPFWYTKPSTIGDGKAHTQEEMFNDNLNMQFGTDLLKLIRNDGNNLPMTASIYNCGQQSNVKPWRPKPASASRWGICAAGEYIDNVSAASNSYILRLGPKQGTKGGSMLFAAATAVGTVLVARKLLR